MLPYKLVYLKGRNAAVGKEQRRNGKLSVKFLVEGDVRLRGLNPKSLSVMT